MENADTRGITFQLKGIFTLRICQKLEIVNQALNRNTLFLCEGLHSQDQGADTILEVSSFFTQRKFQLHNSHPFCFLCTPTFSAASSVKDRQTDAERDRRGVTEGNTDRFSFCYDRFKKIALKTCWEKWTIIRRGHFPLEWVLWYSYISWRNSSISLWIAYHLRESNRNWLKIS